MANQDNAAKARMGKLRKKAEQLGIEVHDEMTEAILREAINEVEGVLKEAEPKAAPAPAQGGFSKSDIMELGKVIGDSVAKATKTKDEENEKETYAEPDPSEVGEFRTYYTPSWFWILPMKRVAGRLVKAPYGKIEFKLDKGQGIQVGSQWQTKYMSTFTTNNTKVQAYMESHPYFNRKFFLSEEKAAITSEQVRYAEAFAKQLAALNMTMAPELYRLGAELGCSMNHNMALPTLRTVLAEKLAEHDVARYNEEVHRIKSSLGVEALLTLNQIR